LEEIMEAPSSTGNSAAPHAAMGIVELAASRLRSNGYSALKNVSCTFEESSLILRGSVPSYYLKQLAQQTVAQLEGVYWIENQIQVVAPK
jgi:osmotically-inducible protein OsmY